MDIVFIGDGIHILANVIIVDSTHVDFVSQVISSKEMIATIIVHAKVVSYCNWHPEDDFISQVVEIIRCLQ